MSDRYNRAEDMARATRLDELEAEIERLSAELVMCQEDVQALEVENIELRDVIRSAAPLLLAAAEAGLRGNYDGAYVACQAVLSEDG